VPEFVAEIAASEPNFDQWLVVLPLAFALGTNYQAHRGKMQSPLETTVQALRKHSTCRGDLRMDDRKHSISPKILYARLGSEAAPFIVDVRRDADFAGAETLVADAFHRSPDNVEQWRTDLPSGRQIVTYCIHGREVSQGVAAALRLMGVGLPCD
jgi:rhodanese-related sulfurtransferase